MSFYLSLLGLKMSKFYSGSSSVYEEEKPPSFYVSEVLYQNRYCNQEDFSLLIGGGKNKNDKCFNTVWEVKIPCFEVRKFASMVKPRCHLGLIVVNSDIMAIGGHVNFNEELKKTIKSVELYSDKSKTWQQQYIQIEERYNFCFCSFMKKVSV